MYRMTKYSAWHVVFRKDLADEKIKSKKELTDKEKGENLETFIQKEPDMFEKLKKASVTGVREQITHSILQSGFYLEFSLGIASAKVNSDLRAVKSSGCFSFFLLGIFPVITTSSSMKHLPSF